MNIAELRKEHPAKGWTAIPESCPAHIVSRICEKRSHSLMSGVPIAPSEQRGYGAWPSAPTTALSPTLESRLAKAGAEIRKQLRMEVARLEELKRINDALALEEARRDADELIAAEVKRTTALVTAELFPWESGN